MKLLSWNIQWGRGLDGRVDFARILRTIQQLGDFDVVCLQEVAVNFPGLPGSRGEDQMAELAAGLPGYTAIYGAATDVPNTHGGRSQFGNAVFSRLPVGQVWRHLLPWPAEAATPSMQRILVEVAVESADVGPLRVMTTHLEYYSQRQRQAQIDAIRRLHAEACAMSERMPPRWAATGWTSSVSPNASISSSSPKGWQAALGRRTSMPRPMPRTISQYGWRLLDGRLARRKSVRQTIEPAHGAASRNNPGLNQAAYRI
ncbi:MAG: Endonuclease/exonuclease/phosphatase [Proteobacteria bacterium]|nr:Endonuclease/exonuclease/phosphatase [Pseudomonadota bacterium]